MSLTRLIVSAQETGRISQRLGQKQWLNAFKSESAQLAEHARALRDALNVTRESSEIERLCKRKVTVPSQMAISFHLRSQDFQEKLRFLS